MIDFNYENDFKLQNETDIAAWITNVITTEQRLLGEINYIFCDDEYLLKLNVEFLNHDTYTDIISFDYTLGNTVSGDIFISVDRVQDNSKKFNTTFNDEMLRVLVHGILHYCGYKDKTDEEKSVMRKKENFYINTFLTN